jgi:hypothetical protein
MKKRFYIKTAFLSLTFMALLSSCLKDSKYYVNFAASKPLIELPGATNVSNLAGPFETVALNIASTPTAYNVPVNIAAPKPLGAPLTVKLSVNVGDTLSKYNAANGTNYTLLPPADYSSTLTVTIPAGQNLGNVVLNINTSLIDPTQQYVLPLTITDGGGQQISNYNTILFNISAKNAYDGVYSDNAFVLRAGDPVLTGNFAGVAVPMSTQGATTVGFIQLWGDGATQVAGVNPILLTVNPATNAVTVSSGINATLVGDPAYNNHYDPATKTFYVSFYWNAGKASRDATDTLTYSGPRP